MQSLEVDGLDRHVILDTPDWLRLWEHRHHWHYRNNQISRRVWVGSGKKGRQRRNILLARDIMGLEYGDGLMVVFLTDDRYDFRRSNLKVIPDPRRRILALSAATVEERLRRVVG